MGRTTSTQRGASRRTAPTTASRGGAARGRTTASRTTSTKRVSKSASRKTPRRPRIDLRPAGPMVPIVAIVLVLVLGWSLYPALKLQYQAARRAATNEQVYASLTERKAALATEIAELQTPEGVEKAARETLGYAKSGEHVYVIIPDGSAAASDATTASMTGVPGASFLQTLLDAVFGVAPPAPPVVEP